MLTTKPFEEEIEEVRKEIVLSKITGEELQQKIQNRIDGIRKEFHLVKF